MESFAHRANKKWLEEGIRHLGVLCQEAKVLADEGDIIPGEEGIAKAVELMKQFSYAQPPHIAVTVNGEIVLSWENIGEYFKAVVDQKGAYQLYKNNAKVDMTAFAKDAVAVL